MPTQSLGEPGECALAMRGLVKIFGNLVAVANLNLDIPKGSFYGFVGPNGAGKSTTLNMATGLLTPDSGTAFVNGIDVWADNLAAFSSRHRVIAFDALGDAGLSVQAAPLGGYGRSGCVDSPGFG